MRQKEKKKQLTEIAFLEILYSLTPTQIIPVKSDSLIWNHPKPMWSIASPTVYTSAGNNSHSLYITFCKTTIFSYAN